MVDVKSDIQPTVYIANSSHARPAPSAKGWLGFNNARSTAAAPYTDLTVASEGQTRRTSAEKSELAATSAPERRERRAG